MAIFKINLDTYMQEPTVTAPGVISLGEPYVFIAETIEPIKIDATIAEIVYTNGTRIPITQLFYSIDRLRLTGEFNSSQIVGKSAILELTVHDDYMNDAFVLKSIRVLNIYSLLMCLDFFPYGDSIDFTHYGKEIEILESQSEMEVNEQKEEIQISALINSEISIIGTYSEKSIYSAVGGRRRCDNHISN